MNNSRNSNLSINVNLHKLIKICFLIYLVVLFTLKVLYVSDMSSVLINVSFNFVPFSTFNIRLALINTIVFIPLGFFYKDLFDKKIFLFLFLSLAPLFELLQVVAKTGVFDITTIIFNEIGLLIGILLVLFFKSKK